MRELEQNNANGIIKIEERNGQRLVNARELHEFLEVNSKYADWIKNRIKKYGFIEDQDYITLSKNLENGGRTLEHGLTIDMAKELSMVENNEKGREARRYFIEAEKQLRQTSIKPLTKVEYAQMLLEAEIKREKAEETAEIFRIASDRKGQMIAIQNERFVELDKEKQVVESRNEELEDHFNSNSGITTRAIALELGMTAQQLNSVLRKVKLQWKQGNNYYLYKEHLSKDYVVNKYIPKKNKKGETISIRQMRWTQRGREMIHRTIDKLRNSPELRRKYGISEHELGTVYFKDEI